MHGPTQLYVSVHSGFQIIVIVETPKNYDNKVSRHNRNLNTSTNSHKNCVYYQWLMNETRSMLNTSIYISILKP